MKKILFALASVALLFATSCKKENVNPAVDVPEGSFLATIDNGANPQKAPRLTDGMGTMTTIDGDNFVIWESGDQISINGQTYITTKGEVTAVFSPKEQSKQAVGSTFHAFFAVENPSATAAEAELPTIQTIKEGTVSNLPMYATCGEDRQLTFHNICAALKIVIPSFLNGATSIVVSSSDKSMNGAFTVTDNAAVMTATTPSDAEKKVTIAKSEESTFATGEVVYIAVPANTYSNLKVEFFNEQTSMWNKTLATCTLDVNKVYNINATPMGICFEALQNNSSVTMNASTPGSFECSTDGITWTTFTKGTAFALTNVGDKVYIKANGTNNRLFINNRTSIFTGTGQLKVSGNIMYLLNGTTPGKTLTTGTNNGAFYLLFGSYYSNTPNTSLIDASGLQLPATTLSDQCYQYMFYNCTNLVSAPSSLPATTLAYSCYSSMFNGCTSLVNIPQQLPATELFDQCYYGMFRNCTQITKAPSMSVSTLSHSSSLSIDLGQQCSYMFYGCTALDDISGINLSAMTLKDGCYSNMFNGCTNLQNAPSLPATSLAQECYSNMFRSCSSLNSVITLPAQTLMAKCYLYMFAGCSSFYEVTIKATSGFSSDSNNPLKYWLGDHTSKTPTNAGTSATDHTPTVHCTSAASSYIDWNTYYSLPSNWTKDATVAN